VLKDEKCFDGMKKKNTYISEIFHDQQIHMTLVTVNLATEMY